VPVEIKQKDLQYNTLLWIRNAFNIYPDPDPSFFVYAVPDPSFFVYGFRIQFKVLMTES
jgi:hypothetical protein